MSGVFDSTQAAALADADAGHWWFRSKAEYVRALTRSARTASGPFADVGGGSGGVTARLAETLGDPILIEGSALLASAAHRRHGLGAVVGETSRLPLGDGTVGVLTLLDVIEHLPSPSATLTDAHRALRPGGTLVVNVPAHPNLWSKADELLGHQRRYTRRALRAEITDAGFEIVRLTHVFSWLVVPVWLRRRHARSPEAQLGLDESGWVVRGLARVLTRVEAAVVRAISVPFGTSLLAVARRPAHTASR